MSEKLTEYDLIAPHSFPARIAAMRNTVERAALVTRVREVFGGMEVPDEDIFIWAAVISNQRLDSYFTRMADSSLQNYAADAQDGVAFLTGHKHYELPTGYSLAGTYETGDTEGYPRVVADFYTVKGIQLNDALPTDNFIKGVQAGLIRDVSIGFKDGEGFVYKCSICGLSMWDWDCIHIPGVKYSVVVNPASDPSQQTEREELCFAWIEHARLSEVSAVFDGATPGAMVIKATRELRGGRLRPETQQMLESAYRINLPKRDLTIPVGGKNPIEREEKEMADKDKGMSGAPDNRVLDSECRSLARQAGLTTVLDTDTSQDVVNKMRTEIERLTPFEKVAAEGRVLRDALVEDAVAEGVRAYGDKFDIDKRKAMLAGLPVETVQEMRSSWKELGDAALAGKKRVSEEGGEGGDEGGDEPADQAPAPIAPVPDEAFGGV